MIGDVGEGAREEIDELPLSKLGNGLRLAVQGGHDVPDKVTLPASCRTATVTPRRGSTRIGETRCSITGGVVVRDPRLPELDGRYIWSDLCDGRIYALDPAGPPGEESLGISVEEPTSFGTDASNRIYVASAAGPVYRIDPQVDADTTDIPRARAGRRRRARWVPASGSARFDGAPPAARPQCSEVVRGRPPGSRRSARARPGRAQARSSMWSRKPVDATLEVVSRNGVGATVVSRTPVALAAGRNEIPWAPAPSIKPGSYILRLRQLDETPAPVLASAVVRILDVEATFQQRSAVPGETVKLNVQTDAPWLSMTLLQCGPEEGPTNSNYEMRGVQVGDPIRFDLAGRRGRLTRVPVTVLAQTSGLYAARLVGPSGHVGYAPLIVRPRRRRSGSRWFCRQRPGRPTTTTTETETGSATPGTRCGRRNGST